MVSKLQKYDALLCLYFYIHLKYIGFNLVIMADKKGSSIVYIVPNIDLTATSI